jgi:ribosomal protein S18 acetylase RimI-like enzyme
MTGVRPANATDETAVIALWHACDLTRPWNDPQADFTRAIHYAGSAIFVAERDGELFGSVMAGFDGHRGWIYYLAVAETWRGRGTARALLDAAGEWLTAQGCPKVELMVREGNPAAGLYERLGWEPQPVRVFARWLDAERR